MRTRFINRCIKSIVATCNVYNTITKEITERKIVVPSGVAESKLEKEISKSLDENSKLLEVVTTEVVEANYRMLESKFVELAEIVPTKVTSEDNE